MLCKRSSQVLLSQISPATTPRYQLQCTSAPSGTPTEQCTDQEGLAKQPAWICCATPHLCCSYDVTWSRQWRIGSIAVENISVQKVFACHYAVVRRCRWCWSNRTFSLGSEDRLHVIDWMPYYIGNRNEGQSQQPVRVILDETIVLIVISLLQTLSRHSFYIVTGPNERNTQIWLRMEILSWQR